MFTSADKGNVTVAIGKNDYLNKVGETLSDKKTYEMLDTNPLKCLIKYSNIVTTLGSRKITLMTKYIKNYIISRLISREHTRYQRYIKKVFLTDQLLSRSAVF